MRKLLKNVYTGMLFWKIWTNNIGYEICQGLVNITLLSVVIVMIVILRTCYISYFYIILFTFIFLYGIINIYIYNSIRNSK